MSWFYKLKIKIKLNVYQSSDSIVRKIFVSEIKSFGRSLEKVRRFFHAITSLASLDPVPGTILRFWTPPREKKKFFSRSFSNSWWLSGDFVTENNFNLKIQNFSSVFCFLNFSFSRTLLFRLMLSSLPTWRCLRFFLSWHL